MKTMKIKMKSTKYRKSNISYLTVQWLKQTFSKLKRKIKFINKQKRHTKKLFQKVFLFFYSKDFIFYKYFNKMYILADIKKLKKIKIYIGTKTTFEKI